MMFVDVWWVTERCVNNDSHERIASRLPAPCVITNIGRYLCVCVHVSLFVRVRDDSQFKCCRECQASRGKGGATFLHVHFKYLPGLWQQWWWLPQIILAYCYFCPPDVFLNMSVLCYITNCLPEGIKLFKVLVSLYFQEVKFNFPLVSSQQDQERLITVYCIQQWRLAPPQLCCWQVEKGEWR